MRVKNVNPEWILTGNGPCSPGIAPESSDRYETGEDFAERQTYEQALQRLPSRALAEELLRRIAISQEQEFCTDRGE